MSALLLARARRDNSKPTQRKNRFYRWYLGLVLCSIAFIAAFVWKEFQPVQEEFQPKQKVLIQQELESSFKNSQIATIASNSDNDETEKKVAIGANNRKDLKLNPIKVSTASHQPVESDSTVINSGEKTVAANSNTRSKDQTSNSQSSIEQKPVYIAPEKQKVIPKPAAISKAKKANPERQSVVSVNNYFVDYQQLLKLIDSGSYSQALRQGKEKLNRYYLEKLFLALIKKQTELVQLVQLDKSYHEAISEFPRNEEIFIGYLRFLMRQGKNALVVEKLQIRTQSFPMSIEVNQLHAAALIGLGQYQAASEIYRRLLRQEPKNPQWMLGLAMCFENLGDKRGAILIYRNTLRRDLGEVISRSAIEDKLVLLERSL